MRNIRDESIFLDEVERQILTHLQNKFFVLRNQVVDNSTLGVDFKATGLRNLKLNEMIGISIIHHFAPEETQFEIKFELERESRKLNSEDKMLIQFLTFSHKNEVLVWLLETNLWSTRDFFGNILKNGINSFFSINIREIRTIVKKPQRKRGYHDKGSRAKDPYWKYARNRSIDSKEQEQIYLRRSQVDHTVEIIRGGNH